jgi:hypothetical protein
MFEVLPPARHASNSSDDEDNGQNRKNEDVEHDSVHHTMERLHTPRKRQGSCKTSAPQAETAAAAAGSNLSPAG